MIEIGTEVNTVRLLNKPGVHVYQKGQGTTLCGEDKVNKVAKLGEEATCRNCWGQLYLLTSLQIDNLFGYPTPEDVKELEELKAVQSA